MSTVEYRTGECDGTQHILCTVDTPVPQLNQRVTVTFHGTEPLEIEFVVVGVDTRTTLGHGFEYLGCNSRVMLKQLRRVRDAARPAPASGEEG